MAIASVLVGVVALLMMFGGIFLSWIPIVGSILSFGAPVLSLVGLVLGDISMSRAKQEGNPSGAALAGVIVNVLAFLFGLLVAMTCGLCNACFSTAMIEGRNYDGGPNQGFQFQFGQDGGWPGIDEGPGMGVGPLPPDTSGAPPPAMPPPEMPPTGEVSGSSGAAPPSEESPAHNGPPAVGTGDATGPPPSRHPH